MTETVAAAASNTGLSESTTNSVFGQAVSFTATVRPATAGLPTPGGSVSFFDNGNVNTITHKISLLLEEAIK